MKKSEVGRRKKMENSEVERWKKMENSEVGMRKKMEKRVRILAGREGGRWRGGWKEKR